MEKKINQSVRWFFFDFFEWLLEIPNTCWISENISGAAALLLFLMKISNESLSSCSLNPLKTLWWFDPKSIKLSYISIWRFFFVVVMFVVYIYIENNIPVHASGTYPVHILLHKQADVISEITFTQQSTVNFCAVVRIIFFKIRLPVWTSRGSQVTPKLRRRRTRHHTQQTVWTEVDVFIFQLFHTGSRQSCDADDNEKKEKESKLFFFFITIALAIVERVVCGCGARSQEQWDRDRWSLHMRKKQTNKRRIRDTFACSVNVAQVWGHTGQSEAWTLITENGSTATTTAAAQRGESCMWTDHEDESLLNMTLKCKANKAQENTIWRLWVLLLLLWSGAITSLSGLRFCLSELHPITSHSLLWIPRLPPDLAGSPAPCRTHNATSCQRTEQRIWCKFRVRKTSSQKLLPRFWINWEESFPPKKHPRE